MRWDYAFSYGKDNFIDFTKNPISQLIGKNGHGKSSVALILEEVLFNKNSKGTKRSKILNRYGNSKSYGITVAVEVDGIDYVISTTRGSTQTVSISKNGVDISAHTSTGTYALIEKILGYDHKTFGQIIYQSSAFSLEFLTATDTARKKFLIDLLRLTRYTDMLVPIKDDLKELTKDQDALSKAISTLQQSIDKYPDSSLVTKELKVIPEDPSSYRNELAGINVKLQNISEINSKISRNNTYHSILAKLSPNIIPAPTSDISQLKATELAATSVVKQLTNAIAGVGTIHTKCPACGQAIDASHKVSIVNEAKSKLPAAEEALNLAKVAVTTATKEHEVYSKALKETTEWEKYKALWDPDLSKDLLDEDDLVVKQQSLLKQIKSAEALITEYVKYNNEVSAHNARVEVLRTQKAENQVEVVKLSAKLLELNRRINNIQILAKTFSPSGFVAYKIESLVKDLEELANDYLTELSGGRFQLTFRLNSSDKLDVVMSDNGDEVDIVDLSKGELARVNISMLLAIRKQMQSLSNTRTNLLILDETIENLDADGKDKLIEVLLAEPHLNTILISHGFSHPLLDKIEVVKEGKISRIENG